MQDLTIFDDLITSLITLKLILEDIDKISKVIDLEINNTMKQLELLEENEGLWYYGTNSLEDQSFPSKKKWITYNN